MSESQPGRNFRRGRLTTGRKLLRLQNEVSMRHHSRCYEPNHDPTDLLDHRTRIHLEWSNVLAEINPSRTFFDLVQGTPVKDPVKLLDGISGSVGPGEIFGIIGPVGSGKSTLLRVLAGQFDGAVYGTVRVNGIERDERWRHCISFVENHKNGLISSQTVLESLKFVAELAIPESYGETERQARIDHALRLMALDPIKDQLIGDLDSSLAGISGGERRRLMIAHELLRDPKILFLDEPTSGLDSSGALILMSVLHQLAIVDSITIVLTAHQPRMSVLSMYRRLLVLHGASAIFCGEIEDAIEYFEHLGYNFSDVNVNIAESILDAVAGKKVNSSGRTLTDAEFKNYWKANLGQWMVPISAPATITDARKACWTKKPAYNRSWWTQAKTISCRQHTISYRESNYILVAFLAFSIFGIYAGFVWFQLSKAEFSGVQDRLGLLFLTPRIFSLLSTPLCLSNKTRIRQERSTSMFRCSASYFGLLVFLAPAGFLICLTHYIPVYYIAGLRYTPFTAFLVFIGFNYLNFIVYTPMGFIIGSLCKSYESSMSVVVFTLALFRLFSGLSANLRDMTPILSWMRFLSPVYYALNGTAGNEFVGQTIAGQPGVYWLHLYALDLISVLWSAGAMMIYGALMFVLAYFAWQRATRPVFNIKTLPLPS